MMVLIVLNDAPYGTERTYNGLRLAGSLAQREGVEIKLADWTLAADHVVTF